MKHIDDTYGVIIVTTVRDGRVYEWQGPSITRVPKQCFDHELLPAMERGELPWDINIVGCDWDTESITLERVDEPEGATV